MFNSIESLIYCSTFDVFFWPRIAFSWLFSFNSVQFSSVSALNLRSVQFKAEVCQFEKFKNSIRLGFILNGRGWSFSLKNENISLSHTHTLRQAGRQAGALSHASSLLRRHHISQAGRQAHYSLKALAAAPAASSPRSSLQPPHEQKPR
jgi:hypothetical protein